MTAQPTTTSTPTPRPAHRLTNIRPVRCVDCGRQISAGRGAPQGSRYICPDCAEKASRYEVAKNYRRAVVSMVSDFNARMDVDGMLWRLAKKLGFSAPLVLQAVTDRSAWLEPATYDGIWAIAAEESLALGFEVSAGAW
jgi:hypothetical protein